MSNLESHLGLRLFISKDTDPNFITSDKTIVNKLKNIPGFNPNEFFIYVHNIVFYKRINRRNKKLSTLVENLLVSFKVNGKQKENDNIRFYNELIIEEDQLVPGVTEWCEGMSEYNRLFEGWYLDEHNIIKSKLITYVSKTLKRKDHRKIKITIKFNPKNKAKKKDALSEQVSGSSKESKKPVTEMDLSLDTELTLNFRGLTPEEINEIHTQIMEIRPISDHTVKRESAVPPTPLLLQTDIDDLLNDIRQENLTEAEIEKLKDIASRQIMQKDYKVEKKFASWVAVISKRSMDGAKLNTKKITEIAQKILRIPMPK